MSGVAFVPFVTDLSESNPECASCIAQSLLWVMDPAQAGVWHVYVMLGCNCQKVFCVICPPSVSGWASA